MKHMILYIFLISIAGSMVAAPRSSVIGHLLLKKISTVNRKLSAELNRSAFYKAMQADNKDLVNAQIVQLQSAPVNIRAAFMGTMIMKKAELGGSPAHKLRLFKEGHKMLEAAIQKDPDNAEYRFLRLMIQENAPGILGYKNDVQKDSEYIRKSYKSLPEDVQHAIADYSKKSKNLKLQVS